MVIIYLYIVVMLVGSLVIFGGVVIREEPVLSLVAVLTVALIVAAYKYEWWPISKNGPFDSWLSPSTPEAKTEHAVLFAVAALLVLCVCRSIKRSWGGIRVAPWSTRRRIGMTMGLGFIALPFVWTRLFSLSHIEVWDCPVEAWGCIACIGLSLVGSLIYNQGCKD
jgi:hypothetical protein